MSKQDNIYERIESYLENSMEGEELRSFELELEKDPELQNKLDSVRASHKLVVLNRIREVKKIIQEEQSKVKNKSSSGRNKITGFSIAVAVLLSAGAFFFIKSNENKPGKKQLATYPDTSTVYKKTESIDNRIKSIKKPQITAKSAPVVLKKPEKPEIDTEKTFVPGKTQTDTVNKEENLRKAPSEKSVKEPEFLAGLNKDTIKTVNQKESKKMTYSDDKNLSLTIDPCENVQISGSISKKAPCLGENNGEIIYTQVSGGTEPYTFTLNSTEKSMDNLFTNLSAGKYIIEITDSRGCGNYPERVELTAKPCKKDFEFCPFRGETLEIPVYENSGQISIFDKSGMPYYHKKIEGEEKFTWNGQSTTGDLKPGYFVFVIQYNEGSVQKGSITIAP